MTKSSVDYDGCQTYAGRNIAKRRMSSWRRWREEEEEEEEEEKEEVEEDEEEEEEEREEYNIRGFEIRETLMKCVNEFCCAWGLRGSKT